jgi:hypothetical protein
METSKKNKVIKAINFIEELNWLLESKKGLDLKDIPSLLRELLNQEANIKIQGLNKYNSINQNKNHLIGILPTLLKDQELFKSTSNLLDFAEDALKIKISKAGNRSRLEYIGLIVCEVIDLNDNELSSLVNALSQITNNKEKLNLVKEEMKKSNFSWNDTIQKLISNNV